MVRMVMIIPEGEKKTLALYESLYTEDICKSKRWTSFGSTPALPPSIIFFPFLYLCLCVMVCVIFFFSCLTKLCVYMFSVLMLFTTIPPPPSGSTQVKIIMIIIHTLTKGMLVYKQCTPICCYKCVPL